MPVQQWGVVALVVLLLLLEAVARFRRAHARPAGPASRARDEPRPSVPSPLPQPVSPRTPSLPDHAASRGASIKDSALPAAHIRTGRPAGAEPVAEWLRPVRNLRRAIVVATILGPPKQ